MTTTPFKPKRRASTTASGPVMLSWFSATENVETKAPTRSSPSRSVHRTSSLPQSPSKPRPTTAKSTARATSTRSPPSATQSPLPPPPFPTHASPPTKLKEPHQVQYGAQDELKSRKQSSFEEIEITGLELLRSDDNATVDSFSFESYARDSFALAAHGGHHPTHLSSKCSLPRSSSGVGATGLAGLHRSPNEFRARRRMSNCSSITGMDDRSVRSVSLNPQSLTFHPSSHHRRGSLESCTTRGSDYNLIQPQPPKQTIVLKNWKTLRRRASMGAVPADYGNRNRRRRSLQDSSLTRRIITRRSSTGNNDLPGFGAYKARRRASLESNNSVFGVNATGGYTGSNFVTSGPPFSVQIVASHVPSSTTTIPTPFPAVAVVAKPTSSSFGASRRGSVGTSNSFSAPSSSLGSGTEPLRGSSHGANRKRLSVGSSCNSAELRPRT